MPQAQAQAQAHCTALRCTGLGPKTVPLCNPHHTLDWMHMDNQYKGPRSRRRFYEMGNCDEAFRYRSWRYTCPSKEWDSLQGWNSWPFSPNCLASVVILCSMKVHCTSEEESLERLGNFFVPKSKYAEIFHARLGICDATWVGTYYIEVTQSHSVWHEMWMARRLGERNRLTKEMDLYFPKWLLTRGIEPKSKVCVRTWNKRRVERTWPLLVLVSYIHTHGTLKVLS